MALCSICGSEVTTNEYVRAKPMVAKRGEPGVYVSAPADEHFFYCTRHGKGEITEAVARDLAPREAKPYRLLWNPSKRDFRILSRLQRLREDAGNVQHVEVVVRAIAAEQDRQAGVQIQAGRGTDQPSGLRMITLRGSGHIGQAVAALLAEGA
jgi:hypothetical protein